MILRRSRTTVGIAAVVVALAPVVVSPSPTADATTDLSCAASAAIYGTRTNGTFVRYEHLEPETGVPAWGAQTQLASWAQDARRIAGPNGYIYSAVNNGELRRRRWNGTGWDTFPGGAQYEVIDRNPGWARYSTTEHRDLITIDALGDIYTVEPDAHLHWRRYDPTSRTWAHRIVTDELDGADLITAAGPGVIYARYGIHLRRFEYDAASQRSSLRYTDSTGWDRFTRIFSPGGDILYGVQVGISDFGGELMWFRYNPETGTWAHGETNGQPVGQQVGTGWQVDYENTAAPDACQLRGAGGWPTRPVVTPRQHAPVTLLVSRGGHLHYSYVDEDGRAVHAELANLTGGAPIQLAVVPGMVDLTGTTSMTPVSYDDNRVAIAGLGLDAELHTNTQTAEGGPWIQQAVRLGGFFARPITLSPWPTCGNRFYAVDQDDNLWERSIIGTGGPNGLLGTWTRAYHAPPIPAGDSPLVVAPDMSVSDFWCLDLYSYDRNTTSYGRTGLTGNGWDQQWISLGGSGFVGQPEVVDDYRLTGRAVFATGADGNVYGRLPGMTTWTAMPIPGVRAAGPPSATVAPDGKFKIVVRGDDDRLHWTSSVHTPWSGIPVTFDPWQPIPGTAGSGTDPNVYPFDGTWVVAYRTDLDFPRLRKYVPPALTASTDFAEFADVPLAPPV